MLQSHPLLYILQEYNWIEIKSAHYSQNNNWLSFFQSIQYFFSNISSFLCELNWTHHTCFVDCYVYLLSTLLLFYSESSIYNVTQFEYTASLFLSLKLSYWLNNKSIYEYYKEVILAEYNIYVMCYVIYYE
jgi:hypothetical protein